MSVKWGRYDSILPRAVAELAPALLRDQNKSKIFSTVSEIISHQGSSRLEQEFLTLALKVHFPADFRSNPNQTHLNELIKVFRIARNLQAGEFDQGWS